MCHPHAMTARSATEYTPAQVAEETGLSIDTLRYYEKIGLLDPVDRDAAGRRRFSDHHLEQLSVARCLRESRRATVSRHIASSTSSPTQEESKLRLPACPCNCSISTQTHGTSSTPHTAKSPASKRDRRSMRVMMP